MKRLFVLFAALAALSTVAAANAFAAGGGTTTCNSDWVNIPHPVTMVNGNLDVPAGATCKFSGEVTGNVTVEGTLAAFGAKFDKNVIVNGGRFGSANWGSTILGNLNISGSQGNPGAGDLNGFWSEYSDSHIYGNVNYSGKVDLGRVGIAPAELAHRAARRRTHPVSAAELQAWLLEHHLAELVDGRLAPTALGLELGTALG
jgi:hypothetical protein